MYRCGPLISGLRHRPIRNQSAPPMSRVVSVKIHAEAHALPFAGSFFDAIVSGPTYHLLRH